MSKKTVQRFDLRCYKHHQITKHDYRDFSFCRNCKSTRHISKLIDGKFCEKCLEKFREGKYIIVHSHNTPIVRKSFGIMTVENDIPKKVS